MVYVFKANFVVYVLVVLSAVFNGSYLGNLKSDLYVSPA
jgi:hypothetical protein